MLVVYVLLGSVRLIPYIIIKPRTDRAAGYRRICGSGGWLR